MEITLMKLSGILDWKVTDLYQKFETFEYTEERGLGFTDLNIEESGVLSGIAIRRTPIFVNVFDEIDQTFSEKETFISNEVDFILDLNTKLAEIYGSSKAVKYFLTTINNTVADIVSLERISLQPSQVLDYLARVSDVCQVVKLQIKEFSAQKGVVGTYDIKSIDVSLAWELVEKYKTQIVKASVEVVTGEVTAVVHVFQNGRFKIHTKPRNSSNSILAPLKHHIAENI